MRTTPTTNAEATEAGTQGAERLHRMTQEDLDRNAGAATLDALTEMERATRELRDEERRGVQIDAPVAPAPDAPRAG